jgi:DNA repair photolyase
MRLFDIDIEEALEIADRVDTKYKPVFDKFPPAQRAALTLYFLPHKSQKEILGVTRPRVVKWYCPFANQRDFPSGHRYCINIYAGCSHKCKYCYAQGYEPNQARCKDNFKKKLLKDLAEIEEFNLPAAPVHLSNSTDPLQPIEQQQKLTLYTLQQLPRYRQYFTSVVILTKNPSTLLEPEYMAVLRKLAELPEDHSRKSFFDNNSKPALRIEASLAFSNQDDADFYDLGAPSIANRMEALKQLRQNDIPVVLRIDPLLPRNPLPGGKLLADFQLPDAQGLSALEELVKFAAENGVLHIVYSVAKIVAPRYKPIPQAIQQIKQVYEYIAKPDKLIFRGGSWRLPQIIAQKHIVKPFLEICNSFSMKAYFCKQNLLLTP